MSGSYCVVGGGISGLVAAYRLRVAVGSGASITVFDPGDRLGGILRTETLCGQPIDVGAEAFVARRPEVPALLEELGLAGRQVGTTGVRPTIFRRGRLHPIPSETVNGIPTSAESMAGLVDDATLARIASEPDRPMRWVPGSDPAVGAVVADRFGEQVVESSVDPMLAGVYAGSADSIGIRSAVPTVAAQLDAGAGSLTAATRQALPPSTGAPIFGAIDGGYRVLLDELVRRSGLRWVQAAIALIERDGAGWVLRDDSGAHWHADGVIVAVPAPQVARLIGDIAPRTAAAAAQVSVASAVGPALAGPRATPFPAQSGVLVATGESLHAKAITLSSRKWGARGDVELLRMSFGRFGDQVARTVPDDELSTWARSDLARVFGLDIDPLAVLVRRWIDAMPQYGPGHRELAAGMLAGLPPPRAIAGTYIEGAGVPACVAAAGRAAAAVVAATTG